MAPEPARVRGHFLFLLPALQYGYSFSRHREKAMTMAERNRRRWIKNPATIFLGPADRNPLDDPVVHRHDEFEAASEAELAEFSIEVDSEGHHYALRKEPDHPTIRRTEPVMKYPDYFRAPVLRSEE